MKQLIFLFFSFLSFSQSIIIKDSDKIIKTVISKEKNKSVFTILQLRYHPNIIKLKNEVSKLDKFYDIELTYITLRGLWYKNSWKGEESKSGGILMNIGIHFFDLLIWQFIINCIIFIAGYILAIS